MKLVVKDKMVEASGKNNTYKVVVEFNGLNKTVEVEKKRYFRAEIGSKINIRRGEKMY